MLVIQPVHSLISEISSPKFCVSYRTVDSLLLLLCHTRINNSYCLSVTTHTRASSRLCTLFTSQEMSKIQRTPPAVGDKSKPILSTNVTKRLRIDDQLGLAEGNANVNPITLEGVMRSMMQQFTETRQLIDTVRSEIKDVNSKIESVKMELKSDINMLKDECAVKFQCHDATMESLNKKIDRVSQTVGALQNQNELIISGIPYQSGENLNSTLKQIGKHLAVKDATTLMMEPRRMKSGSNSGRDGLIVVEFALKMARDEFYSAYLRKCDLKLNHIGLDSDRRVYINESLTSEARKLKSMALHLKKAGKLTSVHSKQGVIHVKSAAGGPTIIIQSEIELERFL